MERSLNVVDCLRRTSKGQLCYDRHCSFGMEFQQQLAEITRMTSSLSFMPPAVSPSNVQAASKSGNWFGEKSEAARVENTNKEKVRRIRNDELCISNSGSAAEKLLKEYEQARTESVQAAVAKKSADLHKKTELEALEAKKMFQMIQEQNFFHFQKQQEEQLMRMAAREEELEQWRANQKERSNYNTRLMMAKIKEAELTQRQLDAESHQNHLKQQQQELWATAIHSCQKAITQKYQVIREALKNCFRTELLPVSVKEDLQKQKEVADSLDKVINAAKTCSLTQADIVIAQQLVELVDGYANNLVQAVDDINKELEIKQQPEQSQTELRFDSYPQVEEAFKPDESVVKKPGMPPEEENGVVRHEMEKPFPVTSATSDVAKFCASPEALAEYETLKNYMLSHQLEYRQLQNDTNLLTKKFKFDLQKAVNIPVNAISSLSGSHVRDKLERLRKLLRGEIVEVSGKRVSANGHPQAIKLCKDLLAKRFVKQGEEQVASKFEAAFAIAATIIGLWVEFPDFGHLLLAHFHKKCSYLVPYYPPRLEGSTEEEHYQALGYIYIDGNIEKQDKFLKRMSGLMRLYAAIICSPVPPGLNKPHPHGIENGWKWLVRVLNLEPWPDVTATLLFDFLETCSHAMHNAYGKQFEKLLLVLCKECFVKIKKVTAAGSGGPVLRLENFLQKIMQRSNVLPPEGMLSADFWYY